MNKYVMSKTRGQSSVKLSDWTQLEVESFDLLYRLSMKVMDHLCTGVFFFIQILELKLPLSNFEFETKKNFELRTFLTELCEYLNHFDI